MTEAQPWVESASVSPRARSEGNRFMKQLIPAAIGAACSLGTLSAAWAGEEATPSGWSIDQDERAVYEAVLDSWLGDEQRQQLVDVRLGAAPSTTDAELEKCTTGAAFVPPIHESRREKSLTGVQFERDGVVITDGSQWKPFDRDKSLAQGKSIEEALEASFSHTLISFSEIAFSHNRDDALVHFQMACGRLCGSGSTMRLHKTDGRWAVVHRCAGYMS